MRLWRIASTKHAAFDGEGARLVGSRWTPRGLAVVYASATLSLAALERFVHTEPYLEPPSLVAIPVDVPDTVRTTSIDLGDLSENWRDYPAPDSLQLFGERWAREARTAALSVPSVVIPQERNYVLNPRHPDFARLRIGRAEPFSFDPRMRRK